MIAFVGFVMKGKVRWQWNICTAWNYAGLILACIRHNIFWMFSINQKVQQRTRHDKGCCVLSEAGGMVNMTEADSSIHLTDGSCSYLMFRHGFIYVVVCPYDTPSPHPLCTMSHFGKSHIQNFQSTI